MAYGYIPWRVPGSSGGPSPNQYGQYTIADDYTPGFNSGDLAALHTDGTIIDHADTLLMIGIFAGVEYVDDATGDVRFDSQWLAAQSIKSGSTAYAYVYDNPDMVFKAQADQNSTALVLADTGELIDTDHGTGNFAIKRSGEGIDSSTSGVGGGGHFKFLGSAELDRSFSVAGTTMDVFVMPNEHRLKAAIDGI